MVRVLVVEWEVVRVMVVVVGVIVVSMLWMLLVVGLIVEEEDDGGGDDDGLSYSFWDGEDCSAVPFVVDVQTIDWNASRPHDSTDCCNTNTVEYRVGGRLVVV